MKPFNTIFSMKVPPSGQEMYRLACTSACIFGGLDGMSRQDGSPGCEFRRRIREHQRGGVFGFHPAGSRTMYFY